jgi:hypothetical protein
MYYHMFFMNLHNSIALNINTILAHTQVETWVEDV